MMAPNHMTFNQQSNARFFQQNKEERDVVGSVFLDAELQSEHGAEELAGEDELGSCEEDSFQGFNEDVVERSAIPAVSSLPDDTDTVGSADHTGGEGAHDTVSIDGFGTYVIPIASTDYKGLEAIDPRLVDRIWRLNNLYTVINEEGELVKFKLRPSQVKLLSGLHYKNIILKARQLGFTTFICVFLLDYALFNKNKQVGIIAHTQSDAGVIFKKVKIAWDNFPKAIKGYLHLGTTGDSKIEYEFSNGSVMRISTSLRSGTYQAVLITEFGKICSRFPDKAEEIITGTLPAVPAKGLIFIESTAEGEEGHYYDMCQDAMESRRVHRSLTVKDYKFFFFPWFENPADVVSGNVDIPSPYQEYFEKIERMEKIVLSVEQRNWYYITSKELRGKMKQENPSTPEEAFLVSGNKLFNGEVIDHQREMYMREPIDVDGDFLIYRRFVKGHMYGLGADVSLGVKRDSSTIVVIDYTTGEVVLTYRSNTIDPIAFAYDIKKAGSWYGICIAAPEANNTGILTCSKLYEIYPNVFTQVREGMTESVPTNKLGWLTHGGNKPTMMYDLSVAIEDDNLHIPDEGILLEAKKFNKEDSLVITVNENTTRHFDLLIALAIAWQMRIYATRGMADPDTIARVEQRREERRVRTVSKYR